MRRAQPGPAPAEPTTYEFGKVRVDFERYSVVRAGKPVPMTARESALLRYFVRHRGRVVTREEILREVWGYDDPPVIRTVDVHFAQLRCKLEANPARPRTFTSLRSVGYRFEG